MTAIIDHQKQELEKTFHYAVWNNLLRQTVNGANFFTKDILAKTIGDSTNWRTDFKGSNDGIHPKLTEQEKAALAEWERTATPEMKAERQRQLEEIFRYGYGCCGTLEHNHVETNAERERATEAK